jgi:DNA-binding response OmpR family regulator
MGAEMSKPLTVLVAEDEPAMRSLVARHLRGLGFFVVEASEGNAAWELAQAHEPDLVILDVMMPGMSGWEVCKRLKSPGPNGSFARTGVIMLTGIGENLNDMTSPLFSADAWLNKPFDFADLDARVSETLNRYRKESPSPDVGAQEPVGTGSGADLGPRPAAPKKKVGRSVGAVKKRAGADRVAPTTKAKAVKKRNSVAVPASADKKHPKATKTTSGR